MSDEALRRIDALIAVGMRLARSAPTGKIVFARRARSLDPAWIPRPWGDTILSELEVARAAASEPIEFTRVERVLADALQRLDWLPPAHAGTAAELARHALGELAGPEPVRLDSRAVIDAGKRLFARPEPLSELILAAALPPQDLWPARGVAQLFGTVARIGGTGSWSELTRSALRDGWDAPLS